MSPPQLDMSNHLIGSEILSLAEMEVPPEDVVFHKFYMNKMNSSKPTKKKKKKAADDEAAENLFDVGDNDEVEGADESDNEEIENMLDSANRSFEADGGEYDYDDLDEVVNEDDDDDLVGNGSDTEMDVLSEGEAMFDDDNEDNDNVVDLGEADDGSDVDEGLVKKKRKRESNKKKMGVSPFASLEDYEHLLNKDDSAVKKSSTKKRKSSK